MQTILLSWILEIERQSQTNSPLVYCCRRTSNIALSSRVGWIVMDCYLLAGWIGDIHRITGWTMMGVVEVGMDARQRVVDEALEYLWMKFGGHALSCLSRPSPRFHKDVPPRLYYFRATSETSVRYDRTSSGIVIQASPKKYPHLRPHLRQPALLIL